MLFLQKTSLQQMCGRLNFNQRPSGSLHVHFVISEQFDNSDCNLKSWIVQWIPFVDLYALKTFNLWQTNAAFTKSPFTISSTHLLVLIGRFRDQNSTKSKNRYLFENLEKKTFPMPCRSSPNSFSVLRSYVLKSGGWGGPPHPLISGKGEFPFKEGCLS